MNVTAIFDVGKTNVKLCLVDVHGEVVWSQSRQNDVVQWGPYPHFDVEGLWQWLLASLAKAAERFSIETINVSTHGACAVLVDGDGAPMLPVMDYEFDGVEDYSERYNAIRPAFSRTFSPELPQGLNLGRQLYWQRDMFPEAFGRSEYLLLYPQYWVYRLSGVAVSEVTSLGCHTDLWCPDHDDYSSMVDVLGIRSKLPPMADASEPVGCVTAEVSAQTGMPGNCRVYAGVHDSNASFARHLDAGLTPPFSVVSTGTWVVTFSAGSELSVLDETKDMLANVNVQGEPLACARFMGGREYGEICRLAGTEIDSLFEEGDIAELVNTQSIITPAFSDAGGPFMGAIGQLPDRIGNGNALATLYLALMIDYELDLLCARGDIVFGSSSTKNPALCSLLAQLRPGQRVRVSGDVASTVLGAWAVTRGDFPACEQAVGYSVATATEIPGLLEYRAKWRAVLPRN